jgi:hypothetical protein
MRPGGTFRPPRPYIAQVLDERQELGFIFRDCGRSGPLAGARRPVQGPRGLKKVRCRLEFGVCTPIISSRTGRVLIAFPG